MDKVLETVDLPEELFGPKIQGKVRDNWVLKDGRRVMVTTDRQSAFDRMICLVPGKGRQLNTLSAWWFKKTSDIIPNHMLMVPHPNVMVCQECQMVSFEIILRAYITGSTSTSLWTNYNEGRDVYGLNLPKGLRKNQELDKVVVTPTTKAIKGQHDRPFPSSEGVSLFGEIYRKIERVSLALFERASKIYRKAGLILVDTKFEFGKDKDGNLILIDELFTPDSSRFWRAQTYKERFNRGEEPESLDKEFLRLWLKNQGFGGDGPVPVVPAEITEKLGVLYAEPYSKLTGYDLTSISSSPSVIKKAILDYL
ncbi:MAG: phosphoribosylaminoimidazolesuccinocarboxamide synthase [bacterium]|nr:phosphoribosylaminoimidazolesuccinocarboxamide synthase [bacterium]